MYVACVAKLDVIIPLVRCLVVRRPPLDFPQGHLGCRWCDVGDNYGHHFQVVRALGLEGLA